jgi:hypothetical protein
MYLSKHSGGLNIVNIEYKLYALRLKHIQEIILNGNANGSDLEFHAKINN